MAYGGLIEIYRARTMQEAALLKNRLEEEGICVRMMNDVLEGGAGVDVLGWATQPRVMVAEPDAERARQVAQVYDRFRADVLQSPTPERKGNVPAADWPRCPSCGLRRLTACPHCGTAGTDFPEGDTDFGGVLDLEPGEAGADPCCGPGGCGPRENEESGYSERSEESESDVPPPTILLCPTCDEPFTPQYLRRCEWCGHLFPDGVQFDPLPAGQAAVNQRILFAVAGLVLLVVALAVYLFRLF